jgi:hypothetical protein
VPGFSRSQRAPTAAHVGTAIVAVMIDVVKVVVVELAVTVFCVRVVDTSSTVEVYVTCSPASVSGCTSVTVDVETGILLWMQEHAEDLAVAGMVATLEANGVSITIVGSGEA